MDLRIVGGLKKFISIVGSWGLVACSPQGGSVPEGTLSEQLALGKSLYEQACAQCHYDGAGSAVAPDLRGSPVLAETPQALARIILGGRQGESFKDGRKLNGVMPPQPYLSDTEIAAVIAYVRDTYGNRRDQVPAAAVAEVRAALGK